MAFVIALMAAFSDSVFFKATAFVVSFLSAVPNYLAAIVLHYFLTDISSSAPPLRTA